ncbi:MAG: zinc-dependent metalloprotease [Saprospiraceae bacterium]|nr:zinc-dependent metalloprotease [Saprospiraceae bacterium]
MRFQLLILFFFLKSLGLQAQTASFQFDIVGGTPEQIAAVEYCGQLWGQYLLSDVDIEVRVVLAELGANQFLGLTLPNGNKDFADAPLADYWYPSALANAMAGTDLKPGENDFDIFLNTSYNWYYGLDGNPASNQFDFVSVMLHEMGHGLGILSLAKVEASLGSFGTITAADFAPLGPSFPFPDLEGRPSIYDSFIVDGFGMLLTDESIYENPSINLEQAFTGNNLFFSGPLATLANNNQMPKLFAVANYQFGSSVTHLNEATYPNGSGNSMMTPFSNLGEVEHHPGPIVLGILEDIGWNLSEVSTQAPDFLSEWTLFPNPTFAEINLQNTGENTGALEIVRLLNIQGEELQKIPSATISKRIRMDMNNYPAGLYFLEIRDGISSRIFKFSKL